jgi:ABC-type multidrug transport system permease subunit
MFRDTLFILAKDVKYMLRGKETLLWVFFLPIVFFYFIGTITGGFSSSSNRKAVLAVKAGEDAGFLVDQLIHRLESRSYQIVRPETDEQFERWSRRLEIPASFSDSVLAGVPSKVFFTHQKSGLGNDYDSILLYRAVYTVLADLITAYEMGAGPSPEMFEQINDMPRALTLDVASAGKRKHIPSGFEQAIPGIIVMFILLVMTTSGAALLLIERRQGLLRRLASTPISRLSVVLGKWGGKLSLGIIQIFFAMLAGTILFKMNWGEDLLMVIAVLLIYGALMASIGILLGSLARSEGQAVGIGVIASNVLAALGGCWWPIEITPQWMQKMQLFLPTGWAMDALHKLISFSSGPSSVLPHVLGMLLITLIFIGLSVKVFRFH